MTTINAKHSGFSGDIIHALPALKTASEKYGAKVNLYIWLNKAWEVYGNYHDPSKNGEGLMNQQSFEFIKPLLESLPYIGEVAVWNGQQIHIDLDKPKVMGKSIGLPYVNMSRQYFYAYPDLACDLSEPSFSYVGSSVWGGSYDIHLEGLEQSLYNLLGLYENAIIVNRTNRWLNPHISYMFLQQYKEVWFVGTLTEYSTFTLQVPNAKHLKINTFFELAKILHVCKLFIGNQSLAFAIAEQMKVPRILEVCLEAPNVMPIGANGFDFTQQEAFEYYVSELMK